jgi:MutL protein
MIENSILAVDFGNVHTRAILIDLVEGVYQLVARAEDRTTSGFPISDVGAGFRRVVQQLASDTGRRFLNAEGTIITPEQPDRSGIDAFIATASIGRPLRTVLIGLMPSMSIASAQRAAAGTYVEILDVISLEDMRTPQEQLNAIVAARPDLVFITGGTENGASEPVLELARITRLALRLMGAKTNVLYAGNSTLAPQINALFEEVATVFVADNVRPGLEDENLTSAQTQLASAFDAFTEQRGLGFDEVGYLSNVGVLPTAQSYHAIVSYLGQTTKRGGVLAVDVGSAVSTLSASVKGHVATNIRTDIGLGHSARSTIDAVTLAAVRKWLPFFATDNEILAYVFNKTLRPSTIPEVPRTLYLEHALLRAALSGLLDASRPTWTATQALDDLSEPLTYFERIIGAGAGLTGTGRAGMTAMLLLDALQPVGVVNLQSDSNAMIPALGALARIKPEAVVQVLDESGLENLCTCFNISGTPRKGRPAARVSVTDEHGETEQFTIQGGELWVYPLSIGLRATIHISVTRGLHINGKRQLKLEVEGGMAGLMVDVRGRPLPLATNLKMRAAQIPEWYAQATGEPVIEIPPEWLEPPSVEPEITSVVDRRKAQSDRVLTVLGDDDNQPKPKSRGRMFGRKVKESDDKEAAPVTEDDDDDLRNLFS